MSWPMAGRGTLTKPGEANDKTQLQSLAARQHILRGAFLMKRASLSILFCLSVLLPASGANDDEPLYGFTAASSKVERDWENKFRDIPSPQILKDTMERLSNRPHH